MLDGPKVVTRTDYMQKASNSQALNVTYPKSDSSLISLIRGTLVYLAFHGHGLRIGLEISLCFLLYVSFSLFLPWEAWGVDIKWVALYSWFLACIIVSIFDHVLLFQPVKNFRNALRFELAGMYDRALMVLESIGPSSKHFVRCPLDLYHFRRAEILMNKELFDDAERELSLAQQAGISKDLYLQTMAHVLRAKGDFAGAFEKLTELEKVSGDSSLLALEKGLTIWTQGKNFWDAKKAFEETLTHLDRLHTSGESAHSIARAYIECARLKIGYAEEALPELSHWVERFRQTALYIETLRPIASLLMMERATYLVTHKEPALALRDLQQALDFCCFPKVREKANFISDELDWRFQIKAPTKA